MQFMLESTKLGFTFPVTQQSIAERTEEASAGVAAYPLSCRAGALRTQFMESL
jgi:hypothetical protein